MKYNLKNAEEVARAVDYFKGLKRSEAIVEITKVSPHRTISQNNYLHLLLGSFGQHFGYSLQEAKYLYKELNKDIYFYEKKGRTFLRSSADLSKEEMAKTVDRFMEASAEQGYPLPKSDEKEWLMQIQNAMEQARYYL